MSMPTLPKGWGWEAKVDASTVAVVILNEDAVEFVKRTTPCFDPADWKDRIVGMAETMWADMNTAAQIGADLGMLVIYE